MKKTLSTVLAILMILSAFVFTAGVSVSAADLEIKHDNTFTETPIALDITSEFFPRMDGVDTDIRSFQTLDDGKTKTVRFAPNYAATILGNSKIIVADGWPVGDKNVSPSKYKYIEVIYYYSVPEGSTPVDTKMEISWLQNASSAGVVSSDEKIVANRWSSAIFDMTTKPAWAALTENVKQYHFRPFGGVNYKNIPENQSLDIAGFTFYSEKPVTTITGGVRPVCVPLTSDNGFGIGTEFKADDFTAGLVEKTASEKKTTESLNDEYTIANVNYVAVGAGTGEITLTVNGTAYPVTSTIVDSDTVTADGFVTGKWATAVIDISAAGASAEQTLKVTPADGQRIFVKSITYSNKTVSNKTFSVPKYDSNDELVGKMDDFIKEGESMDALESETFETGVVDFVGGKAAKLSPIVGKSAYSVHIDAVPIRTEWQPYVRIEYYAHGAVSGTPAIEVEGNVVKASSAVVADGWTVALFDLGAIKNVHTTKGAEFYPFGNTLEFTPAASNKVYIKKIVFSQTEDTSSVSYAKPDLEENGDIRPYIYEDPDGQAVAYYMAGGTYTGTPDKSTSLNPYGDLTAAVNALDKVGGGTLVLLSDIFVANADDLGGEDKKPIIIDGNVYKRFPTHTNLLKVRGTETYTAKIYFRSQAPINGDTWFQKYIEFTNGTNGDTGIILAGKKGIFGEPGGSDTDIVWVKKSGTTPALGIIGGNDGGQSPKVDLTFYSGMVAPELRVLGAWGKGVINGDAKLTIYGGNFTGSNLKGMHGGNGTEANSRVKGNYTISIYGGTFGNNFVNLAGNEKVWIDGDLTLNLVGGTFAKLLSVAGNTNVGGKKILNVIDNPAMASSANPAAFNEVYKVTTTKSGENLTAGVNEVIAGSTSTTAYGGTVVAESEGLTVSADTTLPTHAATVTVTGTKLTIAPGATLTLGGNMYFKDIEIVTGDDSVIDAGNYKLTVDNDVNITGPVKITGTNTNFNGNADDFTILPAELKQYGDKNVTVIALDNFDVAKVADGAVVSIPKSIANTISGGSIVYYISSIKSDKTVAGSMKIEDNGGVAFMFNDLVVNEWGTASFDASQFRGASHIKFTASETALEEGFHLYIKSISFAQNSMSYSLDYGKVSTDRFGEIVIPQDDIVIPGINWVNRRDADGILTEEKPFVAGDTTMLTLKTDAPAAPFVEYKLDSTVNPEWQPYVKVGYYLHSNSAIPTDLKVTAQFGDNAIVEAEQVIVANNYAIATFEIGGLANNFNSFKLYPYGEDATAFDATNKIYMFDTVISREKNTEVFTGNLPKLDENGLIIPYKYTPDDGKAVVYLSAMGTYTGNYKGSVDSTKAYGTMNAAFAALKGVGGYVIVCDDFNLVDGAGKALGFPSHTDMITVRGAEDEDDPTAKVKLNLYYMNDARGPLTFENVWLNWLPGGNDNSLQMGNHLLVLGKKGVADDVILSTNLNTSAKPMFTASNMIVNGCAIGTIRTHTWVQSGTQTLSSMNFTYNEGSSFGTISQGWGGASDVTVTGDVNITVNGGKAYAGFRPFATDRPLNINGNFTLTITGGDFSALNEKTIVARGNTTAVKGKAILNALDYSGDGEALLKKIDQSTFDVLEVNTIYLSSASGDDANTGASTAPVASIKRAVGLLTEVPAGGNPNASYSGKIVVLDYTSEGNEEKASSGSEILIVGATKDSTITIEEGAFLKLAGLNARFKNITFAVNSTERAGIDAGGGKLTMDTGITVKPNTQYLTLIGGTSDAEGTADKADITINSGEYADVVGSVGSVTGGSTITINNGTFNGTVRGGAEDGNVGGDVNVIINGGKFTSDAEIIGGNKRPDTRVGGDIIITINGGDFRDMKNETISAGESNNSSTEKKLNISGYPGTFDKDKIDYASFDAVINPKPPKPDSGSKFVYILEIIRDKNNGLEKAKPFVITQSAAQTKDPVVVSPKQLNLKMDGNDHAIMTVQPIGDGKYETIRYTPNHNPSVGSSVVSDGWNIKGRGVDLDTYKYAEVIYYYRVPEGEEQVATKMTIRPLGGNSGVGIINATPLEANKWATAIFDIGKAMSDKSLSGLGELAQYHFSAFGGLKGPDIPAGQTIDIISLTFYTDKPETTISGGAAPTVKVASDDKKDDKSTTPTVKKVPLVTKGTSLTGQVDKSGAFTGTADTKDDVAVGKIVPNSESTKNVAIEGYSRIPTTENSPKGVIDTRVYRYVVLKYYYETKNEAVYGVPVINIYAGGLGDDENKVSGGGFKAQCEISEIKVNDWNYVMFDINPADQTKYKTMQFHLRPFSDVAANKIPVGDIIYIESLTWYPTKPDLEKLRSGTTDEEEEEEIIEEGELTDADIEAKDPTVVGPEMLRYSYDNKKNFSSTLTTKDEKTVVAIVPGGNDSGAVQIDGTTAVNADGGVISMKNYKYAVISYYFKTESAEAVKPSIKLLSIGIRGDEGAMGERTFTATEDLKANEWATVKIRLGGTPSAYLTKGFILNPFGTTSSSSFAHGDTLYIESVTFCTEAE